MNETLKDNDIEVPTSSRHWDGQHSYDKRLVTLMSKDAGIKVTARKTVRTRKEAAAKDNNTSDAENIDDENDGSQLPGRGKGKAKVTSHNDSQIRRAKAIKKVTARPDKPQTLPTRRSNRSTAQENTSKYAERDSDAEEEEEEEQEDEVVLPQRTNGAPQSRSKRAPTPSDDDSDASEPATAEAGAALAGRKGAAKAGNKRPRQASDVDEDELPAPFSKRGATKEAAMPSLPDGDLTATPASSARGDSPDPVMDLSTQELAETESLVLDLPDSPPELHSQTEAGNGLPRRKRSRY